MLEQNEFEIVNHSLFTPSTEGFFKPPYVRMGANAAVKAVQNPTAQDYKDKNIKPRLTATLRKTAYSGFNVTLRIEFSAPKLMRGNNFDELSDIEFGNLLASLHMKLESMGVKVSHKTLCKAKVSSIHYSKNIILMDYSRCTMIMDELSKLKLWARLDINKTDYRNSGHVLKWHANSYEIAAYDKLKDMQKAKISPKRAFEADSLYQNDLFEGITYPKEMEVLRLEIRLNKRQVMKSLFKKLAIDTELEFESLFSSQISKAVLNHFYSQIMAEIKMVELLKVDTSNPVALAENIIKNNPSIKPAKTSQIIGTMLLVQKAGANGLKNIFPSCHKRTINRMLAECQEYAPKEQTRWLAINTVKQQLDKYEPISIKKYQMVSSP